MIKILIFMVFESSVFDLICIYLSYDEEKIDGIPNRTAWNPLNLSLLHNSNSKMKNLNLC